MKLSDLNVKMRKRHYVANFSMIPGSVYKIHNQNRVTFEDNLKYRRDIPFLAYCDFEKRSKPQVVLDPETTLKYLLLFM